MKTTLDIPDDVFRRAKRIALERNTSFKAIVVQALQDYLGPASANRQPVHTPTWPRSEVVDARISSEEILKMVRRERDGEHQMVAALPTASSDSHDMSANQPEPPKPGPKRRR